MPRKEEIENTFRNSNSHDKLFDAFREALAAGINDVEIYKVLLANPILSNDELVLFTEKLAQEFREYCYEYYMWTAGLFESKFPDMNSLEYSLKYYTKAVLCGTGKDKPLLKILKLYNYDFDISLNDKIISLVENSFESVNNKSRIYKELSLHYKRTGEEKKFKLYGKLSEKEARNKNQ